MSPMAPKLISGLADTAKPTNAVHLTFLGPMYESQLSLHAGALNLARLSERSMLLLETPDFPKEVSYWKVNYCLLRTLIIFATGHF